MRSLGETCHCRLCKAGGTQEPSEVLCFQSSLDIKKRWVNSNKPCLLHPVVSILLPSCSCTLVPHFQILPSEIQTQQEKKNASVWGMHRLSPVLIPPQHSTSASHAAFTSKAKNPTQPTEPQLPTLAYPRHQKRLISRDRHP